jgi:threonine synthase
MPKMIAVQSEAVAPLARAFWENRVPVPPASRRDTLAEGIAIAEPVRGAQILEAVRATGGTFMTVNDAQIVASLREVGQQGAYIEPTAAATTAAAALYLENKPESELAVTVFTGHGLKSTEKMLKILEH